MFLSEPSLKDNAHPKNNTLKLIIISSLVALPIAASAQVSSFDFINDGVTNFTSIDASSQSPFLLGNANVTRNSVAATHNSDSGIITEGWTRGDTPNFFDALSFNIALDPTASGTLTGLTVNHATSDFFVSPRLWAARVVDSSNNVLATTEAQSFSFFNPTRTTATQVANFSSPLNLTAGESYRVQYTAWGGSESSFVIISDATINGNLQAVPEPSGLFLYSFAITGLLLTRKRR